MWNDVRLKKMETPLGWVNQGREALEWNGLIAYYSQCTSNTVCVVSTACSCMVCIGVYQGYYVVTLFLLPGSWGVWPWITSECLISNFMSIFMPSLWFGIPVLLVLSQDAAQAQGPEQVCKHKICCQLHRYISSRQFLICSKTCFKSCWFRSKVFDLAHMLCS